MTTDETARTPDYVAPHTAILESATLDEARARITELRDAAEAHTKVAVARDEASSAALTAAEEAREAASVERSRAFAQLRNLNAMLHSLSVIESDARHTRDEGTSHD